MSSKPYTYLVTGGTGYIGSHIVWELLSTGQNVISIDNLSRSSDISIKRIANTLLGSSDLSDPKVSSRLRCYSVDLMDGVAINKIFDDHSDIFGVVHLAAYKSVPESHEFPEKYKGNVSGSEILFKCMEKHGIYNLVFSSSACVYGEPEQIPIPETTPLFATNPYGQSKIDTENLLQSLYQESPKWKIVILRYFNPVGAHPLGVIGEDPKGLVTNLLPIVAQVALKKRDIVQVFGNDFNTEDGSALRDYIHIMDLVKGHIAAFVKFFSEPGLWVYNLGTGKGYSVLQVISTFQKVTGQQIDYKITKRRSGDVPILIADPSKAKKELNWVAEKGLDEMCQDLWNFQCKNPNGYE